MEIQTAGAGSTRHFEVRNAIASACYAVAFASVSLHLWLTSHYGRIFPTKSHAELGRVHALNIHGTNVFLTDTETTGLSLTLGMFVLGVVLFAIVVPKDHIPGVGLVALKKTNGLQVAVVCTVFVCYLTFAMLAGPSIVSFAVSHGLVLSFTIS